MGIELPRLQTVKRVLEFDIGNSEWVAPGDLA